MTSASVAPHPGDYQVRRYAPNETVPIANTAAVVTQANPVALPGDFLLTHSQSPHPDADVMRFSKPGKRRR
jgi:hypothetical protein